VVVDGGSILVPDNMIHFFMVMVLVWLWLNQMKTVL